MMDDYFLYLVELLHIDDRARELMRNITLDVPPEYLDTDYESKKSIVTSSSTSVRRASSIGISSGFLATMFSNFDVPSADDQLVAMTNAGPTNMEHSGNPHHHSSPSAGHQTSDTQAAYADEANNHLGSPNHQVIVTVNGETDYTTLPAATVSTDQTGNPSVSTVVAPEESFGAYDYGRGPSNGYKFNGGHHHHHHYAPGYPVAGSNGSSQVHSGWIHLISSI